jgi:hypothetical protein
MVSGLWHGANWTFVVWGVLHGVYRMVGIFTEEKRNKLVCRAGFEPDSRLVRGVRRVITFMLVSFAWIFFRANSISDAFLLVKKLCTGWGSLANTLGIMELGIVGILTTLASFFILLIIDRMLAYEDTPDGSSMLTKNGAFIYFVWIIMFAWALLLSKDMTSTFIYFQF